MRRTPNRLLGGLLALGLVTAACGGAPRTVAGGQPGARPAAQAAGTPRPAPPIAPPAQPPTVKPLKVRARPDVLVVSAKRLPDRVLTKLRAVAPRGVAVFRSGTSTLDGKKLTVSGVNPSRFRQFAPKGTAEATPVWEGVARNELVVSHALAKQRKIELGSYVTLGKHTIRVAAFATTLPDIDAVVSYEVADALGLPRDNAALLTAGRNDPAALASATRKAAGRARIHLLTQPKVPYAALTGSAAAQAFGAFSYRWYDDGTIEPDARWVAANIVYASVPILGTVRCHRLLVPQLRAALREVEANGLASTVRSFDGCYVPRFIERNPDRAVSLHTWGIAFDLNAQSNMPGAQGDMDMRVVGIMKRWGFRWGGDWSYPDPMHFELGALLKA